MRWQERVFEHWKQMEQWARRYFRRDDYAQEALTFALQELSRDNWRKVAAWRGDAPFEKYLPTLVHREFSNYLQKRFGAKKPPQWVRDLGPLYVEAFNLLCRRKWPEHEAVEILISSAPGGRLRQYVEETVHEILARIKNCRSGGSDTLLEGEVVDERYQPEDANSDKEREMLLKVLLATCQGVQPDQRTGKIRDGKDLLEHFREAVQLAPEEQHLLRMVFQDGLQVSKAGRLLGINANQVHGRLRRIMDRIRKGLVERGLEPELKNFLN